LKLSKDCDKNAWNRLSSKLAACHIFSAKMSENHLEQMAGGIKITPRNLVFLTTDQNKNTFDFTDKDALSWLAELMKHRDADNSRRYRLLSEKFIEKYAYDLSSYDVIKGWRANASYFYIAKAFVRDEVDIEILEPLLSLGELGIQYCLKSEKAFEHIRYTEGDPEIVSYPEYNAGYNERDAKARSRMRELIDSDANKLNRVFSTIIRED
jgi:hypothetical protein